MSTPTDMAALIRSRILTAPASGELSTPVNLTGLDVIVYQQQSLQASIDRAIGKASGCAVTIEWMGFKTLEPNASRPRLAEVYDIKVWSKPVIDQGNYPAELVIKSIILRMWHWRPQGGHAFNEARAESGGVTPSKSYLIYDCEVVIPISL
jgi:hypothetical protein